LKDCFLYFEYNCEKISLRAITVQKKKVLIETQYRSFKIDQFVEFSKLNLIIYIMSVFIFLRDKLFISKDRKNHNYIV